MSFRIGALVLINSDGVAIQSYGFNVTRILGSLKGVLRFLDFYKVDEIYAVVLLKGLKKDNSSEIFSKIADLSISTPLGIGGGITDENLETLTKEPFFERCIFNSAIFDNKNLLSKTKMIMGGQSLVASIPFRLVKSKISLYNSKKDLFETVTEKFWDMIEINFNEIILLDANSEGLKNGFNFDVLDQIKFPKDRIIISGGLVRKDIIRAKKIGLAGVALDNFSLHSEYSIDELR